MGSTGSGMRLSACWEWITGICHLFLACLQMCWLPIFPNAHAFWVSCLLTHYLFTLIPGSDKTHAHALTLPWIQTHFHTPPPQFTSPHPPEPSLSVNTNSCIQQVLFWHPPFVFIERNIPQLLCYFSPFSPSLSPSIRALKEFRAEPQNPLPCCPHLEAPLSLSLGFLKIVIS